jgi:DNA-binding transcriptional MocR family regulator
MNRPGTFERIYAAIKQQLRSGMYRPGDRLEPALLSYDLNSSVTPVRDALHRLTGERLVEAPRHEGFRVPSLTEGTLRHLYSWQRDLLLLALLTGRGAPGADEIAAASRSQAIDPAHAIFAALAEGTGSPEHVFALDAVAERLLPVERFEQEVLGEMEGERAEFEAALELRDRGALRRAINRYHRRRIRAVPQLLERLQKD